MSLYLKEPSESSSVSPCLDLSSSRISSTSGPPEDMDRSLRSLQVPTSFFFCPPQLLSRVSGKQLGNYHASWKFTELHSNPEFSFHSLQIPLPVPTLIPMSNPEAICESAASLVFLNIKITRSMPTFIQLPPEDQVRIAVINQRRANVVYIQTSWIHIITNNQILHFVAFINKYNFFFFFLFFQLNWIRLEKRSVKFSIFHRELIILFYNSHFTFIPFQFSCWMTLKGCLYCCIYVVLTLIETDWLKWTRHRTNNFSKSNPHILGHMFVHVCQQASWSTVCILANEERFQFLITYIIICETTHSNLLGSNRINLTNISKPVNLWN